MRWFLNVILSIAEADTPRSVIHVVGRVIIFNYNRDVIAFGSRRSGNIGIVGAQDVHEEHLVPFDQRIRIHHHGDRLGKRFARFEDQLFETVRSAIIWNRIVIRQLTAAGVDRFHSGSGRGRVVDGYDATAWARERDINRYRDSNRIVFEDLRAEEPADWSCWRNADAHQRIIILDDRGSTTVTDGSKLRVVEIDPEVFIILAEGVVVYHYRDYLVCNPREER